MKTSNIRSDHGPAKVAGRVAGNRAGSPGIRVYDTGSGDIAPAPEIQFVGAQVTGTDGEIAYVTITGTGQNPTNAAAVALAYGDVVVLTSTGTVTTTTTAQDTRPVGVVQIGGAVGFPVSVVFAGYVAFVNVTAAVTAGNYAETSTTAAKATENATRRTGSFAQYLASGTAPSALLFGIPDSAAAAVSGDYVLTYAGGKERLKAHSTMGATETFDLADGNYHTGTFDANCTFTFTGATNAVLCRWALQLTENGTGGYSPTWPGSVVWPNGVTPTHDTTAGSVTTYGFWSTDGGVIWYGSVGGGSVTVKDEGVALTTAASSLDFVGAGVVASGTGAAKTITITTALTVQDEGTPLTTAATTLNFVGAGVVASSATATKTITIAGGSTATDTNIWRPVVDAAGALILASGEVLMAFGPA